MQEIRVQFLSWENPLERKLQPTPVSLPGESHGQRSLAGYSGITKVEHDLATQPPTKRKEYFILFKIDNDALLF